MLRHQDGNRAVINEELARELGISSVEMEEARARAARIADELRSQAFDGVDSTATTPSAPTRR